MQKSRRLNALHSFFLVAIGSLAGLVGFAGLVAAAPVVVENFDTLTAGVLGGQGQWVDAGGGVNALVSAAEYTSAPNGCRMIDAQNRIQTTTLTARATGAQKFKVKPVYSCGSINCDEMVWFKEGANYIFQIKFLGGSGGWYVNNTGASSGNLFLTNGTWYDFVIEWNGTQSRISIDNGANFPDGWVAYSSAGNPDNVWSYGNGYKDIYFDDFASTAIAGYDPVLTPTDPPRNVETMVDFDDPVAVSGTIAIPTNNTHAYDNLKILFYKPNNAFPWQTLNIPLSLTGGQSYTYSATTTIAVSGSGNNFFKVVYNLSGRTYAGSHADNPVISMPLLPFDNTWIKDSVASAPASILNQAILPTQEALEDCDSYSGIDAVVCRFKNFIMGAFLPSNDALAQISGTMDALKTKFPMNYASAVSSSFGTIAAGVDDNSGFTFSLYGHSGTADTSFFTQDLGSGITIGGSIKLILTFLVLMLFLLWGINYMHRVLPK